MARSRNAGGALLASALSVAVTVVVPIAFVMAVPGAPAAAVTPPSSSDVSIPAEATGGPDGGCPGGTLQNHDGTFENAYGWVLSGVVPPDYGAFAERFRGAYDLCEIHLYLTQIGNQAGQTMDVFIWDDDDTDDPGAVLLAIPDVDPGPIGVWPAVTRVDIPVDIVVTGKWWVGWWGNWPGAQPGWLAAADENGPGGVPRTRIAPAQGYPTGWEHPNIVLSWSDARSMGIEVGYDAVIGVPDAGAVPGPGPGLAAAPNPFRAGTVITFAGTGERSRLDVFDVAGRRVGTLGESVYAPGIQRVSWNGRADDGRPVAAGVYYVRIDRPGSAEVLRLVRVE